MARRDEEIKRLIHYAKGLGATIEMTTRPYSTNQGKAYYLTDSTKIVYHIESNDTKIETILILIHELGHLLDGISKGRPKTSKELSDALHKMNTQEDEDIKSRYLVYLTELDGIAQWDKIITDCNIKIPKWRIALEKEYDTWFYEVYWKTGKFPLKNEFRAKRKELKVKHYG